MVEENMKVPEKTNGKKTVRTVVLTIISLIVLLIIIFVVFVFGGTSKPLKVVETGVDYLAADNFSGFYELTTEAFQSATSQEDLETLVKDYPILLDATDFKVIEREVNTDGQAYLYGNVVDTEKNELPIEFLLFESEDGSWLIQGFNIEPVSPASPL